MNDLDLYDDGGALQPYSPAAPLSPSPGIGADIDVFGDAPDIGQSPRLFGQPIDAPEHAELITLQIVSTFKADAVKMGLTPASVNAAVKVFRRMATQPVPSERQTHNYNLSNLNIGSEDQPYITAFANQMARLGADQESVRKCIWWYGLLVQHLNGGQQQQRQSPNITEAQNARDIQNGENQLRQIWGYQYKQNLAIVKRYIAQFPASERDKIETETINGHMAGNDAGFILHMYEAATGGPIGAGSLAKEIAQLEKYMRENLAAYLKDETAQHRLRRLYQLRDG